MSSSEVGGDMVLFEGNNNNRFCLSEIAKLTGASVGRVRHRYKKLGKPKRVFTWMFTANNKQWRCLFDRFQFDPKSVYENPQRAMGDYSAPKPEKRAKCEKSGRQPVKVIFEGAEVKLADVAIAKGCPIDRAWKRWNAAGRPFEITDDLFTGPIKQQPSKYFYTVDGKKMTYAQIAAKFKVARSTLNDRRVRNGKTAYTSDELIAWREAIEERNQTIEERSSKWKRGPGIDPPFGHDLPPEQRSLLRLMSCFG